MGEDGTFRVGIKAGCFTLLHAGHVHALRYCAERCDHLIVLISTDDKIFRKKGCVPLPLEQRLDIIESIKGVEEVHSFNGATEDFWVMSFKTNQLRQRFGLGAELIIFHDPEVSHPIPCQSIADEIVFVPHTPPGAKYSVTDMFDTIDRRNHE